MIRAHVVTWDPVTEQCGAPDICPECMRAEFKRERDDGAATRVARLGGQARGGPQGHSAAREKRR